MGYLIEASLFCRAPWEFLIPLLDKAEWWLSYCPPDNCSKEKAFVWINMGIIQIMYGNTRKGHQACQNAYQLARAMKNPRLECLALSHSLKGLSILGEFRLADRVKRQLEVLAESIKDDETRTWVLTATGVFYLFTGNGKKALEDLTAARKLISENGLFYFYAPLLTLEIIWHGFFGNQEIARSKAQEVIAIAEMQGNDLMKGNPYFFLSLSYYKSGQYDKAAESTEKALQYFTSEKGYSGNFLFAARTIQGLLNHRRTRRKEIINDLEEILGMANRLKIIIFRSIAIWPSGLSKETMEIELRRKCI